MTLRIENVMTAGVKRRLSLTSLRHSHNRRESKTDSSKPSNKPRLIPLVVPHVIHGSKHNLQTRSSELSHGRTLRNRTGPLANLSRLAVELAVGAVPGLK